MSGSILTAAISCGLIFWVPPALAGDARPTPKGKPARAKLIAGWLERVTLVASGHVVKAKLDTGAKTSSLHATSIEQIERDGTKMVRFVLEGMSDSGQPPVTVERKLVRNVRIKEHKAPSVRRPVVEMEICLDGRRYRSQFTLADRSNFHYPVLLGRRFLAGVAVVDPAKKYLTEQGCPGSDVAKQ